MPPTAAGRLRELIWALVVLTRETPGLTCAETRVRPYPARFAVHDESVARCVELRIWPDQTRARIHVGSGDGNGPGPAVAAMTLDLNDGYWLGRPTSARSPESFGARMCGSATSAAEELLGYLHTRLRSSSRHPEESRRETG